jgi:hypothetical protein
MGPDNRRRVVRKWSPEEDLLMTRLVEEHGTKVRIGAGVSLLRFFDRRRAF